MAEEWRTITGYNCAYQVSDLGKVRKTQTNKILQLVRMKSGRLYVTLCDDGFCRKCTVHKCGYSFPDADMNIKYLLKRAQTNRDIPLKVTVINNPPGKRDAEIAHEKDRYARFLGGTVEYTDKSFQEFADNPLAVIRPLGPDEIR